MIVYGYLKKEAYLERGFALAIKSQDAAILSLRFPSINSMAGLKLSVSNDYAYAICTLSSRGCPALCLLGGSSIYRVGASR
jgi:hypothetical protein